MRMKTFRNNLTDSILITDDIWRDWVSISNYLYNGFTSLAISSLLLCGYNYNTNEYDWWHNLCHRLVSPSDWISEPNHFNHRSLTETRSFQWVWIGSLFIGSSRKSKKLYSCFYRFWPIFSKKKNSFTVLENIHFVLHGF